MVMTNDKKTLYACTSKEDFRVTQYSVGNASSWEKSCALSRTLNDEVEYILQLKLDKPEETLMATTGNGFVVWFVKQDNEVAKFLALPNGVRNISTKMMCSNSIVVDGTKTYAVAGVRWIDTFFMRLFFFLSHNWIAIFYTIQLLTRY